MTIFLIRHGETESNARRIVQTPDTPLSERGMAQADLLGQRLAKGGVERILSSDLSRASMTAKQLQAATHAPIDQHALLQERNYGDIRGLSYDDIGVDIFDADYAPPGGETWAVFYERAARAWQLTVETAHTLEGNLAVVTHGLVCRAFAERHLALPDGWAPPAGWDNTSLTIVEAAPPWSVRLLNCTAHLEGDTGVGSLGLSGM